MSVVVTFKSNLKEVKKVLTEAETEALELIGAFVEGEAVLRCPVMTGNLRSSINHKVDHKEKAVHIGTPVIYGIYVEKGSSKQQPQPFITPALEDNVKQIEKLARMPFEKKFK